MHLSFLDPLLLIETAGYVGITAIVFAESGLFFGFFLPGDSLLFSAGLLSSQGILSVWILLPLLIGAAILGDSVGYWFGKKTGPRLFTREDSLVFKKKYLEDTRAFYAKHGPKALILARFMPIARTFTPILAGAAEMPYPLFLRYNILGGILWTGSVTLFGHFLGGSIPNAETYLLPVILGIVILSFVPAILEFAKAKRKK